MTSEHDLISVGNNADHWQESNDSTTVSADEAALTKRSLMSGFVSSCTDHGENRNAPVILRHSAADIDISPAPPCTTQKPSPPCEEPKPLCLDDSRSIHEYSGVPPRQSASEDVADALDWIAEPFSPSSLRSPSYISDLEALSDIDDASHSRAQQFLKPYCSYVIRRPRSLSCFYLLCLLILVGVGFRMPELNMDFSDFIKADGEAMRNREALLLAMKSQKNIAGARTRRLGQLSEPNAGSARNSSDAPYTRTRLQKRFRRLGRIVYTRRTLSLFYTAKGVQNLDRRVLSDIQKFEFKLRDLASWRRICHKLTTPTADYYCDPGDSFIAMSSPTHNVSEKYQGFMIGMDGRGNEPLPAAVTLALLQQAEQTDRSRDMDRFFSKDFHPSAYSASTIPFPTAMRSQFHFLLQIGTTSDSRKTKDENKARILEEYITMIQGEVYPLLKSFESEFVNMYYEGDYITMHEVQSTLLGDAMLAVGSVVLVTCFMWMRIGSAFVSICCLFMIFASLPLAYVTSATSKMTIASLASLFLMVGIASDNVFVFVDFWRQSKRQPKMEDRLAWMMLHAVKACLATSLTTSISFFANMASCLQPLREFGLFMGLCVVWALVLIALFLPPLLVILERRRERRALAAAPTSVAQARRAASSPRQLQRAAATGTPVSPRSPSSPGSPPKSPKSPTQRRPPAQVPHGQQCIHRLLVALGRSVARCPLSIAAIFAFLVAAAVYGVARGFRLDQGLPAIFPEGHNQAELPTVLGKFKTIKPLTQAPGNESLACGVATQDAECDLHWCDSVLELDAAAGSNVSEVSVDTAGALGDGAWFSECRLSLPDEIGRCTHAVLNSRIASPERLTSIQFQKLVSHALPDFTLNSGQNVEFSKEKMLVMEDWSAGNVAISPVFDANSLTMRDLTKTNTPTSCLIRLLCFVNTSRICDLPSWRGVPRLRLATRRLAQEPGDADTSWEQTAPDGASLLEAAPSRWLQSVLVERATVPASRRADVNVVYGLLPPRYTPLVGDSPEKWQFDPSFYPQDPWAQRAIRAMCTDLTAELRILAPVKCWIESFQKWLSIRKYKFPTRDFDKRIAEWVSTEKTFEKNLWFEDQTLKASTLFFAVDFSSRSAGATALAYKAHWDEYVSARNKLAASTANRAWHTAGVFVRAEAEAAIIGSTRDTIVASAVCAWFGVAAFTGDIVLACVVLILVLGITCGLAFFMVVVMGWAIGPLEVLSLIIFLGYSITYTLHIAHSYSCIGHADLEKLVSERLGREQQSSPKRSSGSGNDELRALADGEGDASRRLSRTSAKSAIQELPARTVRELRTQTAVLHIGGATLSSAASTIMSSIFLLFCTLNIFVKLGVVVIVVTALSILCALIVLPAVLFVCGPSVAPWYKRLAWYLCALAKEHVVAGRCDSN